MALYKSNQSDCVKKCNINCFASEWIWMTSQKRSINSAQVLALLLLLLSLLLGSSLSLSVASLFCIRTVSLNAAMSSVISLATTMNSQLDPKAILKHAMEIMMPDAVPAHCISHATKYPNGVLQLNGHLPHTHTHKWEQVEQIFGIIRANIISISHAHTKSYKMKRMILLPIPKCNNWQPNRAVQVASKWWKLPTIPRQTIQWIVRCFHLNFYRGSLNPVLRHTKSIETTKYIKIVKLYFILSILNSFLSATMISWYPLFSMNRSQFSM